MVLFALSVVVEFAVIQYSACRNALTLLTVDEEQVQPGVSIIDYESLAFSVAVNIDGSPIWFADRENFSNSRIVVTEISTNGNFIGFGFRQGYEFDINSEIIFETQYPGYEVHHSIIKSENETYFFLDYISESLPCPDECSSTAPDDLSWVGDRIIEVDLEGNLIWDRIRKVSRAHHKEFEVSHGAFSAGF